ncbi:hypothetical protein LUZ60_008460 [Juncus effusus]|nr:hypothetical protein LUZ60_008460 [Juncus effusus]
MDLNDWDLFALVRSCGFSSPENSSVSTADLIDPSTSFQEVLQEETILNFSGFKTQASFYEVESEKVSSLDTTQLQQSKKRETQTQTPRVKKSRKNQLQKVVRHVPVSGGVSSDLWAWRKYGQKPIKGSPYPRGYYRCSSLKGCMARKQVERDPSDPSMFIITYTGDHIHAVPTHRNSLAGISRPKFPPAGTSSSLVSAHAELSPVTPLTGDAFEEEDHELEGREIMRDDDHEVWFMGLDGFEERFVL